MPLPGFILPPGLLGARRQAHAELVHSDFSNSLLTTFSFSDCNFGAASPDRYLVLLAYGLATQARSINSATIGGVAATAIVHGDTQNIVGPVAAFIRSVPAGTSGTVTFTMSASTNRARFGLWALTGLVDDGAPTDIKSDLTAPLATSLNCPAGSVALGMATVNLAAATFAWGGLTGEGSINNASGSASFASAKIKSAEPSKAISATQSSGSSEPRLYTISFK